MNLRCFLAGHEWEVCTYTRYYKSRHKWSDNKYKVCGQEYYQDWRGDVRDKEYHEFENNNLKECISEYDHAWIEIPCPSYNDSGFGGGHSVCSCSGQVFYKCSKCGQEKSERI